MNDNSSVGELFGGSIDRELAAGWTKTDGCTIRMSKDQAKKIMGYFTDNPGCRYLYLALVRNGAKDFSKGNPPDLSLYMTKYSKKVNTGGKR